MSDKPYKVGNTWAWYGGDWVEVAVMWAIKGMAIPGA